MQRSQNGNLLPWISTPVLCRRNQGRTINGSKLKFKWQFKGNYCGNTGNGSGSLGLGLKRRWNLTANAEGLSHPPCDAEKPRILLPGKKKIPAELEAGMSRDSLGKAESLGMLPKKRWSRLKPLTSKKGAWIPKLLLKGFLHLPLLLLLNIWWDDANGISTSQLPAVVFIRFLSLPRWVLEDLLRFSALCPPKNFGVWGGNGLI